MLKQDKPLEFALDDKGNANSVYSNMGFNVYEVEQELIETAKQVLDAYENGFKPCLPESSAPRFEVMFRLAMQPLSRKGHANGIF